MIARDQAVNDLGITRLGRSSRASKPGGYFQQYRGQDARDYVHIYAPQLVNDDDPNHINLAGFQVVSTTDRECGIPLRNSWQRGRKALHQCSHVIRHERADTITGIPVEYAELCWQPSAPEGQVCPVPDAWEVALSRQYGVQRHEDGSAIAATAPCWRTVSSPAIASSTTNMSNAQTYFNAIKNVTGRRRPQVPASYHTTAMPVSTMRA